MSARECDLTDFLTTLATSVCRARALERCDSQSPEPLQSGRSQSASGLPAKTSGSYPPTVSLLPINKKTRANSLFSIADAAEDDDDDDDDEDDDNGEDDDNVTRYLRNTGIVSPLPINENDLPKDHDGFEELLMPEEGDEVVETGREEDDLGLKEGLADVDLTMGGRDQNDQGASSQLQPPERSPCNKWDNGENVTADERIFLLAMETDLERARAMNIRRRDREALEDGLIEKLPPFMAKPIPSTKSTTKKPRASRAKGKGKAAVKEIVKDTDQTSVSERGGLRRKSARRLKNAALADHPPSALDNDRDSPTSPLLAADLIELANSLSNPALDEDTLPPWIEEAMPYLLAMCDDVHWTSLLLKWVELERQLGFIQGRVSADLLSFLYRAS